MGEKEELVRGYGKEEKEEIGQRLTSRRKRKRKAKRNKNGQN